MNYKRRIKWIVTPYIESQYRELLFYNTINAEFADLYLGIEYTILGEILTIVHYDFLSLFRTLNERLPTNDNESYLGQSQAEN